MTQSQTTEYGALLLRVTTGVLFLAHGLLKVLVFTIPGTVGYFESLGLPAILAYLTIIAEIGGGIALIIGFQVRLVSLALIPLLLGAGIVAHGSNGWLFSNEGGGWEFPIFWAFVQGAVALLGAGAHAFTPGRAASAATGA